MWRPRDRERFIGGYDPEHEMPDPDRDPRDRYQSEAYRHNARDSRFAYRWNPDRVESRRFDGGGWNPDRDYDRDRGYDDSRIYGDRNCPDYGQDYRGGQYYGGGDYGRGGSPYGGGIYGYGGGNYGGPGYGYRGGSDRGSSIYGQRYDRDQSGYGYGGDRGWDHDRGFGFHDRGGYERDRYDRGYDRDRGYAPDRGFDDDRDWRNRR
jgi:hypothetical protein